MTDLDEIAADFEFLRDWEQRYQYLTELGEALAPMPADEHVDANRVHACMSKVWVRALPDPTDPVRVVFHGDCDTAIIKGVVALLVNIYSGRTREAVLALDVDDLFERIQLAENLSPNRHVGVYAIVEGMKAQVSGL